MDVLLRLSCRLPKHRFHKCGVVVLLLIVFCGAVGSVFGGTGRENLCIETSRATNMARFVTPADGVSILVASVPAGTAARPIDFFHQYGAVFGVNDANRQLMESARKDDVFGNHHTFYSQVHDGVPVYGAQIRVHSDAFGRIRVVNGTFVPDIEVSTVPTLREDDAVQIAVADVAKRHRDHGELDASSVRLLIYRRNLARGLPGSIHLAYEVEVQGGGVREFVFVDAHDGIIVDRISGVCEGASIHRRIYDIEYKSSNLIWDEGDPLPPSTDVDHNNMIEYAEDIYNLVASASDGAFISWNALNGFMDGVYDPWWLTCPNASWNGIHTSFCIGVTGDDTVAHEWAHAYTDSTHNLIYQWQPGALNEAYSDIFGEVVDLLNGSGDDTPNGSRVAGGCSTVGTGTPPPDLQVTSPLSVAGTYIAGGATFNPPRPIIVQGIMEEVDDGFDDDGFASVADACQPLLGFTPDRIALIEIGGGCAFDVKVRNAQDAGAVAAVIVNGSDDSVFTMGPGDPPQSVSIPCIMVGRTDGQAIRDALSSTVIASVQLAQSTDPSLRWLQGESDPGFHEPIRDMWNPSCFGDPGKVSDYANYWCGTADDGGVHTNSGVPNHAFALLVDGGSYNGRTIPPIGLTKAFHVYWRAQTVYQVPTSGFPDHADALEQSCTDLIGVNLMALDVETPIGSLSGEVITPADCAAVGLVVDAVELRQEPVHCGFSPMLEPDAPPLCGGSPGSVRRVALEDWESGMGGWTAGVRSVYDGNAFSTPDWRVVTDLPDGRAGSAAFVADLVTGDCVNDIEAGVLYLQSPVIHLPADAPVHYLAFDHWAATELGWDGGNVKVRVIGEPYRSVDPTSFLFNAYPDVLEGAPSDNPLAGEWAFTGTDGGKVDGSWGQSQIDLTGLAAAGDDIQIRFEMGLDGCNGQVGWYVDEVSVYNCCDTYGDVACDGSLDAGDYGSFAGCLFGPNAVPAPLAPMTAADCLDVFNADADADVDLADYARIQQLFTGP